MLRLWNNFEGGVGRGLKTEKYACVEDYVIYYIIKQFPNITLLTPPDYISNCTVMM